MGKILVADDEIYLCELIASILGDEGFDIIQVNNGEDAIFKMYEEDVSLAILDVQMPGLNGFEVCDIIKKTDKTKDIPVIFVTGLQDRGSKLKGLEVGGNDFVTKPVDAVELKLRVKNMLKIKEYSNLLKDYNTNLEKEIKTKTFEVRNAYNDLALASERLKEAYIDTIYRLSLAAEYNDRDTSSHLLRISWLSSYFCSLLKLSRKEIENIYFASPMHDIGKIGISNSLLLKPSALTETEFKQIQEHTTIGSKMLKGSDSEILQTAAQIAATHHEKYDGTGYPNKLKGVDIPLSGRIVMLIDVYDAIRSIRPYKQPISHKDAMKIIAYGDNRIKPNEFDPEILKIFIKNDKKVEELYNKILNDDVSFQSVFVKKEFLHNVSKTNS